MVPTTICTCISKRGGKHENKEKGGLGAGKRPAEEDTWKFPISDQFMDHIAEFGAFSG